MAYNLFCLSALYGVPLLIIVICYSQILFAMSRRSRDTENDMSEERKYRGRLRLRRSDIAHIERARARTLKMTVVIVLTFFWCWTPYVVMSLWYLFDPASAEMVDSRIQSSLFMFAVSNSCVNPLVYGSYALDFKKILKQCLCHCFHRNEEELQQHQQQHFNHSITTATCKTQLNHPIIPHPRNISVNLNQDGRGTHPCLLDNPRMPRFIGNIPSYNTESFSSLSTKTGTFPRSSKEPFSPSYHSAGF